MARPRAAHIPTDFWRQFIGAPNESPSFRGALRGNAQRVGTSMESAMTTIDSGVPALTFINVFTVAPKDQQRLIDILTAVTQDLVRHQSGFVSSALHKSLDGTRVTMYAQWRSMADYEAMREDPRPEPFFREALSFASFEPQSYEVVATFVP